MKAKIKAKKEIAKDTLLVEFDVSQEDISFKAGQFFSLTLIDPPFTDQKGNQRLFTILNSQTEKNVIKIATRIRKESAFKRSLAKMPLGSLVEIDGIMGSFTLPDDLSKPFVFIAGGIGITPYISMLDYLESKELRFRATLIYANRDREATAFLDKLKRLAQDNPGFNLVLIMTGDPGWEGETRRINSEFIREYIPDFKTPTYYVSGPPVMVTAVSGMLENMKINKEQIRQEGFSGY